MNIKKVLKTKTNILKVQDQKDPNLVITLIKFLDLIAQIFSKGGKK